VNPPRSAPWSTSQERHAAAGRAFGRESRLREQPDRRCELTHGGFFIGMILGIIGGSLAFGWTPISAVHDRAIHDGAGDDGAGKNGTAGPRHYGAASRHLASVVIVAVVAAALMTGPETGRTLRTSATSATFSSRVVLYATKLSGELLGLPLTLTPGNAESRLLQLLNTLTPLVPVTMTDVTVQQPMDMGNSGAISGLTVTAS